MTYCQRIEVVLGRPYIGKETSSSEERTFKETTLFVIYLVVPTMGVVTVPTTSSTFGFPNMVGPEDLGKSLISRHFCYRTEVGRTGFLSTVLGRQGSVPEVGPKCSVTNKIRSVTWRVLV